MTSFGYQGPVFGDIGEVLSHREYHRNASSHPQAVWLLYLEPWWARNNQQQIATVFDAADDIVIS